MAKSTPTISHDPTAWLLPVRAYILSKRCSRCKAEPWTPCIVGKGTGESHAVRMDRGIDHYHRDISKFSSWVLKPGHTYGTISSRP